MHDQFNRKIDYLRLAVTRRCNLNCTYCGNKNRLSVSGELGAFEIQQLVRTFVKCGVKRLRLTGGEPLLRTDLTEIIERAAAVDGLKEISLTTNGTLLTQELAFTLKEAGLARVNISIDSLNPLRYKEITGGGNLDEALAGVEAALVSRLTPLHINVVLLRGVNDDEADDFILYARKNPVTVRFIELMPFSQEQNGLAPVPNSQILERHPYLTPVKPFTRSQPSVDYSAANWKGKVGFISPMSDKFCGSCNRIRVLFDGRLKTCLGDEGTVDLKPLLDDEAALTDAVKKAVHFKPPSHNFEPECGLGYTLQEIGG